LLLLDETLTILMCQVIAFLEVFAFSLAQLLGELLSSLLLQFILLGEFFLLETYLIFKALLDCLTLFYDFCLLLESCLDLHIFQLC
jgi:hypothetical protein